MKAHSNLTVASALLCTLGIGFAMGASAVKPKEGKNIPFGDMKFADMDPTHPGGVQVAPLWGDAKKGPVAVMLKMPAGFDSGVHSHTGDYHGVVIQGSHTHYKDTAADGKAWGPGSYWFQPGKVNHGDACAAGSDCVLLIYNTSKLDFIPAKGAAKPAEKAAEKPAEKPAEAPAPAPAPAK